MVIGEGFFSTAHPDASSTLRSESSMTMGRLNLRSINKYILQKN
jgi:hypothetical protein